MSAGDDPGLPRVQPGKIILGRLGDIESGVRQPIRARPLETSEVTLPSGRHLRVPTVEETLRMADPCPRDVSVTRQLESYRNLARHWTDWNHVRAACRELAAAMVDPEVGP